MSVIDFMQLHQSALTSGSEGIGEALSSLCDARSVLDLFGVTGQFPGRLLPQGELSANPSGTFGGFL